MSIPNIHLAIMQPSGYVHSLGFVDQARYVRHHLRRFGTEVTLGKNRLREDAVNIVFGAHLGFPAALRDRHACMFFNLEQLGHGGARVSPDYLRLLQTSAAVDYDADNVPAYCSNVADVPVVPFQYAPYLDTGDAPPLEARPIDLLFFGSMNERRRQFIRRVEACGVMVTTFDAPIYGPERDAFVRQAKAVLNCSFYETSRFEQVRVSHCLSLGTPVVSERHPQSSPPAAFEESVFWLADGEIERFFGEVFGRPAFFKAAREQLAHFRRHDPVEPYADLMAFAAGFRQGFKTVPARGPWQPSELKVGAAGDYRPGWLNVDSDPAAQPDLVLDLGAPLALPLQAVTRSGGELLLAEASLARIDAADAPARLSNLEGFMHNSLALLRDEGRLEIRVPCGAAAHDPRLRRTLTPQSWSLFTDGFWRLGWLDYRFELAELHWFDTGGQPCDAGAAAAMGIVLRKRATSPRERTLARTMRSDFGGVDDDGWQLPVAIDFPAAALPSLVPPAPPAPLALTMDADAQRVDELVAEQRHADALWHMANSVNTSFLQEGVAHHALYYPRFDRLIDQLAQTLADSQPTRPAAATQENHLIVATELYRIGGHSKVVEEIARELKNPVLVLTDLFGRIAQQPTQFAWIDEVFAMAQVVHLPGGSLWERSQALHEFTRRLQPASVWYFNHHQDPIPFVGTLGIPGPRKILVHHCDHNPSLGATLAGLHHVDITDKLQQTCSDQLAQPTALLRLYVADQGVKSFAPVRGRDFSVVTAGRAGKFVRHGPLALAEIVATTLSTIAGRHFHIGPLPQDWRAEIAATLVVRGLNPARFVSQGAVASLWQVLKTLDAAVYIGSAPVSGGRGGVEAQGCGYPVLPFTGFEPGSLLADYSSYADLALGWDSLAQLAERLAGIGERHAALSAQARAFYEAQFSHAQFADSVRELLRS